MLVTITKTLVFLSSLEGAVLIAPGDGNVFGPFHESGDGSPSPGCFHLQIDWGLGTALDQSLEIPLGTWEACGVPPSAEVLYARLTAGQAKTLNTNAASKNLALRLLDQGYNDILDGSLFSGALPSPSAWTSLTPGSLRNVDFLAQESTQQVKLELRFTGSNASGTTDFYLDTLELSITYDDGGGSSMAIPVQNLDGLVFMKGFAFASRIGGTPDAVGMAALQECSLSHGYTTAEARGPESLQPLGVGITEESLTGSIRYMVCTAEQFQVFIGGTIAYNGGTGKTTWTKKVNEEPSGFNLHLKTPEDGSDLEVYVYNCLATNQPIVEGGANREFKTFGVDFRAYGQTPAQGGKLIETIHPGNQTGAS